MSNGRFSCRQKITMYIYKEKESSKQTLCYNNSPVKFMFIYLYGTKRSNGVHKSPPRDDLE
jgi:hypothetical protein